MLPAPLSGELVLTDKLWLVGTRGGTVYALHRHREGEHEPGDIARALKISEGW